MPKLILSMDGLVLKEIALDRERITIGRKQHNDIQIDNLAVSGQHALITTILDDAFLEDLNSTNGTYVNGQPIKKHVLRGNDVIELGKYRLKYIVDTPLPGRISADFTDAAAFAEEGAGHGMVAAVEAQSGAAVRSRESSPDETGSLRAPAAGPGEGDAPGVIQVLSGPNAGRELILTKSLTTLGKPGLQVAVITRRRHGYFITHVEGATFPQVNGRSLDAQARRLDDHDIIEIAGVKMEFFLRA